MRLMKLLALADRESIRLTGRPITGDRHVAMEHGPVLSQIYNLISKDEHHRVVEWRAMFANEHRDVIMVQDPGDGCLSNFDIDLLKKVSADFRRHTTAQLRNFSHALRDWEKNQPENGSRNPIPVEDTIDAVGRSDKKELFLAEAAAEKAVCDLLAAFRE
jgi:uncharacterized phage-associated protein